MTTGKVDSNFMRELQFHCLIRRECPVMLEVLFLYGKIKALLSLTEISGVMLTYTKEGYGLMY